MSTVAAIDAVACPKCGYEMYDNRASKKNPAQPDFKCKRYKEGCEGVIWPPRNTKAPAPKIAPKSGSNVPDSELPELLRDAAVAEQSELAAKVGFDLKKISTDLALYQGITEWVNETIAPIYAKSGVGMSPESATAAAATIFIQAKRNQ